MTHSNPLAPAMKRSAEAERQRQEATPRRRRSSSPIATALDDASRRALRRRLALFPEHAQEYLDLVHFDELEAVSPEHQLSDDDVTAALAAVRSKLTPPTSGSDDPEPGSEMTPPFAPQSTVASSEPEPSARRRSRPSCASPTRGRIGPRTRIAREPTRVTIPPTMRPRSMSPRSTCLRCPGGVGPGDSPWPRPS